MLGGSRAGLAVALVALVSAAAPASSQEPASVVVAAVEEPALVAAGDGWTANVQLANMTTDTLSLTSQPRDLEDEDCRPRVPRTLAPARVSSVPVAVPPACALNGASFEFEIDAETLAGETVASIPFRARSDADGGDSAPSTAAADAIAILLAIAAAVCGLLLLLSRRRRREPS